MDWTYIFGTAIGTAGGTLITVITAWLIYRSERQDVRERNEAQRVYDLIQEITENIHDIQNNIYHLQTYTYVVREDAEKDNNFREYNKLIHDRKITTNLAKRLNNKSVRLTNLSDFHSHNEVDNYVSLITKFSSNDLNYSNYNSETIKRNVKELENLSTKLLNNLQKLILNTNENS